MHLPYLNRLETPSRRRRVDGGPQAALARIRNSVQPHLRPAGCQGLGAQGREPFFAPGMVSAQSEVLALRSLADLLVFQLFVEVVGAVWVRWRSELVSLDCVGVCGGKAAQR